MYPLSELPRKGEEEGTRRRDGARGERRGRKEKERTWRRKMRHKRSDGEGGGVENGKGKKI